jgi:hypothetical protein
MQGSSTNIYSGRNSIDPVASRTRPFLVCYLFAFATPFALALLEPIVIGMATKGAGATSIDRRRRAHNMLDSACADPGYALRWCEQARTDGDMKEARLLLRSALGCSKVADYASIYKAWIAMELRAGNVDAARGLFHEWGSRIYAGEDDSGVDFWCMFINFEVWNGGADRARAVARVAAETCPSDPTIYAKSLKVEVLFRHGDRVLAHNLDNFAMDVDCKDWLVHYQVGACHDHDHHDSKAKRLGGGGFFLGRMCRGVKRLVHPHGYQPLHQASSLSV